MAKPVISTYTLPYPSSFSTSFERQGTYTKSLNGTTRRAINSDKHIWVMGFKMLTIEEFDSIKSIYDLLETVTFTYSDLNINADVHLDIGKRTFVPGVPGYYSSVEIILIEA